MSLKRAERHYETDLLVIGGGFAGCFTAITARQLGVKVTIVDKGYVGRTSGIHMGPGEMQVFNPARGHKFQEWLDQLNKSGEYLNNQDWSRIVLNESLDRFKELVDWGIEFKQIDGQIVSDRGKGVFEHLSMVAERYLPALRRKALETGVTIIDRVMACELLKQDEKVIGVIGFHTVDGDLCVFLSKATVIATGGSGLKLGQKPINYWTADGETMAYRAGAEISGKEFYATGSMPLRSDLDLYKKSQKPDGNNWQEIDGFFQFPRFGKSLLGPPIRPVYNSDGHLSMNPDWDAHVGRIPLYGYLTRLNDRQTDYLEHIYRNPETLKIEENGAEIFKGNRLKFKFGTVDDVVNVFGGSGIWPVNARCATKLDGLYAVGTMCATMAAGTTYPGQGFGLSHCAVTGHRAAHGAVEYISQSRAVSVSETEIKRFKEVVTAPVTRTGGFTPRWVTQLIQSITVPYFILQVKHGDRLKAALTLIEFVNGHIVPEIMAEDAHGWRMAYEAKNMALDLEMRLRASLYRTESRGTHFRQDYPRRNDPKWLAWVKVKQDEQGKMKVIKQPIPQKWWPDSSAPYEKKYPYIFPGE